MKKDLGDTLFPLLVITLAVAGTVAAVACVVLSALGVGGPDVALGVVPGIGVLLFAGCAWVCYALTGGEPSWRWAKASCEAIRAWQRVEQRKLRDDVMRHLGSLGPEERAKELERLTDGSSIITMDVPDKESFLHPRNWPYGRVNAPDGLSD